MPDADPDRPLPFGMRVWFAWLAFWRVLFDGAFAARAWRVRDGMPALPASKTPAAKPLKEESALALLALLQREGRLLDFLEQDITTFEDAEVGAAARVVQEGCRKALHAAASIEPVRDEEEESELVVPKGYDPATMKLTGNVAGKPPYRGVLRHRGWRVRKMSLPHAVEGHDATVVAPAEVELN